MGNFGWVFEEVYEKAYEPMILALEQHPTIKVGLHYSGPLLEWMESEQPSAIERLRGLVGRGQVEILGGGLYEPILVSLPLRDRHAQLTQMRGTVARLFGLEPSGAWLAERVWEPSLPSDLAAGGYAYTVLDDNHLRGAQVSDEDMWGTYSTDDQGRRITIFGTEKGLRYLIPFRPVKELIAYLREHATDDGNRLGIMGDDGEKFGAWPGTHELCWGNGRWVEDCFKAIEDNADWLSTVTPSGWMAAHPPVGRVYVPDTSYVEMTEWALAPQEARAFHALLADGDADSSADGAAAASAPFLRGGLWRNFLVRYREINDMHKQMLRASAAVDAMVPGTAHDVALDHLLRGQSNDCYWHGLFGGVYIVHMRMATLAELIAAEDMALGMEGVAAGVADYDLDGIDEVLLGTVGQTVLVDVAEGAGIGAWDLRASRVALASVMRRRPEAYHETLREMEAAKERGEKAAGVFGTSVGDELLAKESGLTAALVYDDHERRSGLVRLIDETGHDVGNLVNGSWRVDAIDPWAVFLSRESDGVRVLKSIGIGEMSPGRRSGAMEIVIKVSATRNFAGTIELEWNLNLLGGGGNPVAYYEWNEREVRHDTRGSVEAGTELSFGNSYEGVHMTASLDPPATQEWFPVETVSNSEAGFERVYQGSCLTQRWPVRLAADESASFKSIITFHLTRDRAAQEP